MISCAKYTWNYIPLDDIGYVNSEELLTKTDDELRKIIARVELNRYGGARNWHNLWRSTLGLDSTRDKTIHDYGCGCGIEALQFAKLGNRVYVSDIHESNVALAKRVLRVHGFEPVDCDKVDIFYSNGVLHHSPHIREILKGAVCNMNSGGEIRLLLYSDLAWRLTTQTALPPIEDDVSKHPAFPVYVDAMDPGVGEYADWYNREKLEMRVGDFLRIESFNYILQNGLFVTATLSPKD